MKKINIEDKIFLFIILIIIGLGFIKSILFQKDVNNYENRMAYKYELPTTKTILNKEFQDNIENTLTDQLPLAITSKKIYNFTTNYITKYINTPLIGNYCQNNYVHINNILTFGCNNIVYSPLKLEDIKNSLDKRIANINKIVNKNVYVYYIERDTDIDFTTNNKSGIPDYIKKNLHTNNFHTYETNSFLEYKEHFYETDHHWNYKGSYEAYKDLTKFLKLKNVIEPINEKCSNNKMTGSKANISGANHIYKENFCVYEFPIKEHTTYINGNIKEYGQTFEKLEETGYGYGAYYGGDEAEIIFDYHNPKLSNILIIGESFDNAILKLLSTHYNKTFSIDLRHYERIFNKKFNYQEYIKQNKIDTVLLIGNVYYFTLPEFNLEG